MNHRLSFAHEFQFRYLQHDFFPVLDVTLIGPSGEDDLIAIIDTGAKYCFFNGVRAASIGIELGAGRLEVLSGLSGPLMARIHKVDLQILGTRFQCEVAFSEQPIARELLGRHTLFNQVCLGFREGLSVGYFHPSR